VIKKCLFCGRYFIPDVRVKGRQKVCHKVECKMARRQLAQSNWCNKNPGYFKGRYWYVKEWRKKRKESPPVSKDEMIQDEIPPSKPVCKLILLIPGGIKTGMIQDEIILRKLNRSTFVADGYG
jgi:hypothetical protein